MIFLLHLNGSRFTRALNADEEIEVSSSTCAEVFWELAAGYPEELIVWCEEKLYPGVDQEEVLKVFQHDLIMASCPVNTQYIPDTIGYVDQLPFVNPDYSVKYPNWRMSTDLGGIRGRLAIKFWPLLSHLSDFGYLLNSMAKTGQQNSLFCYSVPGLISRTHVKVLNSNASTGDLFKFVAQHYKKEWLLVLLFCFLRYEHKFPLVHFFSAFLNASFFRKEMDLSGIEVNSGWGVFSEKTIDVIIPTLNRPAYLLDVLKDLQAQTYLPRQVIIVEQDSEPDSASKLDFLNDDWLFKIVHHFIHRTGACNARNLGLKEVSSDYIFFADDDIRLPENLLEKSINEFSRLGISAINLNSKQPGERSLFKKIKQWGAFGSGTAIVSSKYALKCKFSEALEFGFGEDIDYGMQLRAQGCDIIYHPDLEFTHLKADSGGLRSTGMNSWESGDIEPKPSPTMMLLVRKYYSLQMLRGYKVSLFLKYYRRQKIKNPFKYLKIMNRRWKKSEYMAKKLLKVS